MKIDIERIKKVDQNFALEKSLLLVHAVVSLVLALGYFSEFKLPLLSMAKPYENFISKVAPIVSVVVFAGIGYIMYNYMEKQVEVTKDKKNEDEKSTQEIHKYKKEAGLNVMTLAGAHLVLSLIVAVASWENSKNQAKPQRC